MTPELQRMIPIDRLGAEATEERVVATDTECELIATRLDIPAVLSFECRFVLTRDGAAIQADGELSARLERICVASLDAFETVSEHRFRVRFVPASTLSAEIDLDLERDDEIPYTGSRIDIGEAAVEELALTLDPYPRKPGAGAVELPADEDNSPFAALARRQT